MPRPPSACRTAKSRAGDGRPRAGAPLFLFGGPSATYDVRLGLGITNRLTAYTYLLDSRQRARPSAPLRPLSISASAARLFRAAADLLSAAHNTLRCGALQVRWQATGAATEVELGSLLQCTEQLLREEERGSAGAGGRGSVPRR